MHLFQCLDSALFIQQGWAIVLFTILIKLVIPITYKSFLSQAKNESLRQKLLS
jgi:YidC/Oxa1 family membrane protein insertase